MASSADLVQDEERFAKKARVKDSDENVEKEERSPALLPSLPPEILHHIVSYLDFDIISKLRLVCRAFNALCREIVLKELRLLTSEKGMQKYNDFYSRETPSTGLDHLFKYVINCLRFVLHLMENPVEHERCRFDAGKVIERSKVLLKTAGPENAPLWETLENVDDPDIYFERLRSMQRLVPHIDISLVWERFRKFKSSLILQYIVCQQLNSTLNTPTPHTWSLGHHF